MKNSRSEKLSEHLLNIDDEIITHAYDIDDAEKLRQYIRAKNVKTKKPFYRKPEFRKIAVTAACLALMIGVMFSVLALFHQNDNAPHDNEEHHKELPPPWLREEENHLKISCIGQLNYYAAVKVITEDQSAPESPESPEPNPPKEPIVTPKPPASSDSHKNEKIYYYSMDPNDPFYINRVSMFQIELTDKDGFLASKLGLGIVDVVITEDCLDGDHMITFRNGDNFFACFTNRRVYFRETGERQWEFSTHKYVEGFFFVKNLEQENYSFNVKINAQGQITAFDCVKLKNPYQHGDQNVSVVSSTIVSEVGRSFTIAELENYFNTGKIPPENESEETVVPPESVDPEANQT